MKKSITNINTHEYNVLNTICQRATYYAIRGRLMNAGTTFLFELADSIGNDNRADKFFTTAEKHTQLENQRATLLNYVEK